MREIYFGLESGGQSGRTSMGLPPLCTVGAAEFEPPASGRIALFSTAMEFDVLSLPLPDVAAGEVVQLVSCFSLDGVVDWATAGPTISDTAKIAAPIGLIILSLSQTKRPCSQIRSKTFRGAKSSTIHFAAAHESVHIAGHFTIAAKKLLTVHTKWIGRCGQPGAKLQHGSVQSLQCIWAMRTLWWLDGGGDAG
jgi:hypothetical protein